MSVTRLTSPNFGWAEVIPRLVLQPSAQATKVEHHPIGNGWHGQPNNAGGGEAGVPGSGQSAVPGNGKSGVTANGAVRAFARRSGGVERQ
jgi:hypothetical protein